jgi:uncharacterized protein
MTSNPIDIRVQRHDSIDDFPASEWDSLLGPGGFYGSHTWLKAVARHQTFTTGYVSARDSSGRLLAAFPLYTTREQPEERRFDPSSVFQSISRNKSFPKFFPATIVGLRSGYSTDFPFAEDLSGTHQQRVLAALSDAGAGPSDATGGSFSWLYVSSNVLTRIRAILPAEPCVQFCDEYATLNISWRTFDEYLSSLKTGRRYNIRKDMADFADSGCKLSTALFRECFEECVPLSAALQRRYGAFDSISEIRNRLKEQATLLGERAICFLCRFHGKLVGFSLFYQWRDELYSRLAGFDYDQLPADSRAYFTLLFYEPIIYAIHNDIRIVDYGIASTEAKVLRGAALEPRWSILWNPADEAAATGMRTHNEAARHQVITRYQKFSHALPDNLWDAETWRRLRALEPGSSGAADVNSVSV